MFPSLCLYISCQMTIYQISSKLFVHLNAYVCTHMRVHLDMEMMVHVHPLRSLHATILMDHASRVLYKEVVSIRGSCYYGYCVFG